jgi:hypothetical protein
MVEWVMPTPTVRVVRATLAATHRANMSLVACGSSHTALPKEAASATLRVTTDCVWVAAVAAVAPSSCAPNRSVLQMVVSAKYLGNSTLCTRPKVCVGKE